MIDPILRPQVEQDARRAAQRARQVDLNDWLERLKAAAGSPRLAERLALAQGHRWAGAIPTWEPVDLVKPTDAQPLETVGIDGSQIYPLNHSPILWAYIQVVTYCKQRPPLFESQFVDIGTEIAHGDGLAVVFPAWMKYVYQTDRNRFVQFAVRVWGVEDTPGEAEKTALQDIARHKAFL